MLFVHPSVCMGKPWAWATVWYNIEFRKVTWHGLQGSMAVNFALLARAQLLVLSPLCQSPPPTCPLLQGSGPRTNPATTFQQLAHQHTCVLTETHVHAQTYAHAHKSRTHHAHRTCTHEGEHTQKHKHGSISLRQVRRQFRGGCQLTVKGVTASLGVGVIIKPTMNIWMEM